MMDPHYKPEGWLGMVLGTKFWIDFRNATSEKDSISRLIKEIGIRGKDASGKIHPVMDTTGM